MSQRKEKSIRQASEASNARWRRRAREAERSADLWRRLCWAAVAACALVALLAAMTIPARSEAPEAPETAPAVQVIPTEAPEAPENESIEAALRDRGNVIEDCTVTYYDCCVACCGKDDGITASGVRATPGVTVAVDPAVIPLGSDVLADYGDGELHYYRADDTGAGVRGAHIDLCVADHETARLLGVRTATVYWVAP